MSLMTELSLSDLTLMDTLEENLQQLTQATHEPLGTYLWRAQGALTEYNTAAPRHAVLPVIEHLCPLHSRAHLVFSYILDGLHCNFQELDWTEEVDSVRSGLFRDW